MGEAREAQAQQELSERDQRSQRGLSRERWIGSTELVEHPKIALSRASLPGQSSQERKPRA
jgi:hypothetical protein